ncbi:ropporin-1-like protein [Camelus ferus]|uniref:Ropporin-1-like protein n=1 Tax=Camelus ferus TaxID=419612 RepID=A0A8B8S6Q2_CAMFR|nr:ropporin-1-like protein [Camelus ferus]XP_032325911.1 ropporin-1-like protein [Camelus ferus]
MPLPDTMFCAQQIHIPPELPDILKQFTKAAIRTQPADVLQWSAGYFSALSRGDPLPVKDRIEMPVATQKTDTGLTQGLLKVLHKQCSHKEYVELADLEQKWKNLCLPGEKFRAVLELDPCKNKIEWIKFLALGCSMLGGSLTTAMKHLCEILTSDPEGGAACIPFETFSYVYRYLSGLDSDIPASDTETYLASLKENVDSKKNGMIGLSDFFVLQRKI